MRKTIGTRRAIRILIILLVIWAVFFLADFALASHGHDPVFCLSAEYNDKGNKDFFFFFYRIAKTTFIDDNGNEQTTYILSPWIFDDVQYNFSVGSMVYIR